MSTHEGTRAGEAKPGVGVHVGAADDGRSIFGVIGDGVIGGGDHGLSSGTGRWISIAGFLLGISRSGGQFVLSEAMPGIQPVEGGSALTGGGAGTDTRVGKSGSSPVRGAPTLKPGGADGDCAAGS